jgi:hypothetical protein
MAGLSYSERATILKSRFPPTWDLIIGRLESWARKARPSQSHLVLSKVLMPQKSRGRYRRLLTSNVDDLLETAGFLRRDIVYCHGEPSGHEKYVFSIDDYWKNYDSQLVEDKVRGIVGEAFLFIGYSHSLEDFDVARAISALKKQDPSMQIFSLNNSQDVASGSFRERLLRERITLIPYQISRDADLAERDMKLSHVLLELARQAGLDADNQDYSTLRQHCDRAYELYRQKLERASIVLGLAGINRHIRLGDTIPTGGRRASFKTSVQVEPGGPGYIVSKIIQETNNDSFLVTKIGDDQEGSRVLSTIDTSNRAGANRGRIFTDFVDRARSSAELDGFRTWESFILEPSSRDLHRVFLDRAVDTKTMVLPKTTELRMSEWIRQDTPRIVYFDKFFRQGIQTILQDLSASLPSETVWTVYETGSEGDRYSETKPGAGFDAIKAYRLEKILSPDDGQLLNVVTASFRFARDFLASTRGGIDAETYARLVHKHDNPEIAGSSGSDLSEDQVIAAMVDRHEENPVFSSFCEAVGRGANRFLRRHDLRMIVVTLHGQGCIMMTVPSGGPARYRYIEGIEVPGTLYTASAGDVFRGVLVSALASARKRGADAKAVMADDFAEDLGRLCNECAAHKVAVQTVEMALPQIRSTFARWEEQLTRKAWYNLIGHPA